MKNFYLDKAVDYCRATEVKAIEIQRKSSGAFNRKKCIEESAGKSDREGQKKRLNSENDEDWANNKSNKLNDAAQTVRLEKLSPELAAIVGAEQMARHEVVKKVWSVIKERNLYDPEDAQFAICDDQLFKVFGVKRFKTFGMIKYIKDHFVQ